MKIRFQKAVDSLATMIYFYSFINSKVPLTAFVMICSLTLSNQKWKVICLLALKKWLRKNWPTPGWQLWYDPTHSWPNYEAMQFLKVIKIRYLDTRSTGHLLNHTASFAQILLNLTKSLDVVLENICNFYSKLLQALDNLWKVFAIVILNIL